MLRNFFHPEIICILLTVVSCTSSPISVYHDNPHYFSYKGEPLVLITSDQHYGAVIDMDFDYVKYLDYLAQNGMNLTRTLSRRHV